MIFVSVGLCLSCNHGGTLYDGRCDRCRGPRSSMRQDVAPKGSPAPGTVNALLAALVAQLEADEVPAPLGQRFTLAYIWHDLALLAGEPVPAHIAEALYEPTHAAPFLAAPVETHRELAYEPA